MAQRVRKCKHENLSQNPNTQHGYWQRKEARQCFTSSKLSERPVKAEKVDTGAQDRHHTVPTEKRKKTLPPDRHGIT